MSEIDCFTLLWFKRLGISVVAGGLAGIACQIIINRLRRKFGDD